jgi:hypothetical protein
MNIRHSRSLKDGQAATPGANHLIRLGMASPTKVFDLLRGCDQDGQVSLIAGETGVNLLVDASWAKTQAIIRVLEKGLQSKLDLGGSVLRRVPEASTDEVVLGLPFSAKCTIIWLVPDHTTKAFADVVYCLQEMTMDKNSSDWQDVGDHTSFRSIKEVVQAAKVDAKKVDKTIAIVRSKVIEMMTSDWWPEVYRMSTPTSGGKPIVLRHRPDEKKGFSKATEDGVWKATMICGPEFSARCAELVINSDGTYCVRQQYIQRATLDWGGNETQTFDSLETAICSAFQVKEATKTYVVNTLRYAEDMEEKLLEFAAKKRRQQASSSSQQSVVQSPRIQPPASEVAPALRLTVLVEGDDEPMASLHDNGVLADMAKELAATG